MVLILMHMSGKDTRWITCMALIQTTWVKLKTETSTFSHSFTSFPSQLIYLDLSFVFVACVCVAKRWQIFFDRKLQEALSKTPAWCKLMRVATVALIHSYRLSTDSTFDRQLSSTFIKRFCCCTVCTDLSAAV
jgi:hypothetical protein